MKQLTKATLYYLLHLFTKALELKSDAGLEEMFGITKDAAQAIEAIRFDKGVSEKAVAESLGVTPEEYIKFIEQGDGLQISAEGIKSLAKLFGMKPEELAAKMVEGTADPTDGEPGNPNGDAPPPTDPTKSAEPAKPTEPQQKSKLPSLQIIKTGANGDGPALTIAEIAKADKEQKRQLVAMALGGMRSDLADVRKANILPSDFAPSGVLQPAVSNEIINLVVGEDGFLSKTSAYPLRSKKERIAVDDLDFNFKRFDVGWPADSTQFEKMSTTFVNFDCNQINVDFLIQNNTAAYLQNERSGLEQYILQQFITKSRAALKKLLLNGTADSTNAEELDWTKLCIGWNKLALTDCDAGQKHTYTTETIMEIMDQLIDGQVDTNEPFYTEDQSFIMSAKMFKAYRRILREHPGGFGTLTSKRADLTNYEGHEIIVSTEMADRVLLTRSTNLAWAFVAGEGGSDGITVERHPLPGGIFFRVTMHIDAAIKNLKAMNISEAD
jgi:transcriptional regulator with XRE-family HTH domain